jgi:hypothetical protein
MTKLIYRVHGVGRAGPVIHALSDRWMAILQFRNGRAPASIPIQPFWSN